MLDSQNSSNTALEVRLWMVGLRLGFSITTARKSWRSIAFTTLYTSQYRVTRNSGESTKEYLSSTMP